MVVSHPGIGSAIETSLRLERTYDVRWVPRFAQADLRGWSPDAVVADRALPPGAPRVPTVLLVAEVDPELTRKRDATVRYLREDAPVSAYVAALDDLLARGGRSEESPASLVRYLALVMLLAVLLAALGYLVRAALG